MSAQANESQVPVEIDRLRSAYVRLEEGVNIAAAYIHDRPLDVPPGESPRPSEALEHRAHHVVDRAGAGRGVAHDQVEHRVEQLALQVSAGAVVAERARVGAVRDDAHALGSKAGVPRAREVAADEPLQVRHAARVEHGESGTPQEQVGVQHREPLAPPQPARPRRRPVAHVAVFRRMDAHQVPRVEVLVRGLRQQRAGIARERRARRAERDRAAVLERALGPVLEEKRIVAIGCAPEQHDRLASEPLDAANQRRGIERRRVGERPIHHAVRHVVHGETPAPQPPHEQGRVHEDADGRREERVRIEGRLEPGRDLPLGRQLERQVRRRERRADNVQERVRPADQPARGREKRTPRSAGRLGRRQVDPVAHQRPATRSHHAPQGAVFAGHRGRAARCLDPQRLDEAPVAVVVLGMRDHRKAERVGDVAQPQLDVESRNVARLNSHRIPHDGLGTREPDLHALRVIPQRILGRRGRAARDERHKGEAEAGNR